MNYPIENIEKAAEIACEKESQMVKYLAYHYFKLGAQWMLNESEFKETLDLKSPTISVYTGISVERRKEDNAVRKMVDKIGLNEIYQLFDSLGLNKNSELIRKMYRDMGYSLFGYWEIFYWEANNDIADEYVPLHIS